jgi:hypothetical protein
MRRTRLVLAIVLAGCAAPPVADDLSPTTSTSVATSTTLPATTITTAPPFTVGGEFVRIDPVTLEPLPGYQPVAFAWDSWNLSSDDGSYIINFEWDDPTETSIARVLDVEAWAYVSESRNPTADEESSQVTPTTHMSIRPASWWPRT